MAITDPLMDIKKYFCRWHEDYYERIHTKETKNTNDITNQEPSKNYLVRSGVLYDYLNTKIQELTNNFNSKITQTKTELNNKIPTLWEFNNNLKQPDDIQKIVDAATVDGFSFDSTSNFKVPSNAQDGLMQPEERALLYYCTHWYLFTGKQIIDGRGSFLSKHMQMRVNLGLGLVFFRFSYGAKQDGTSCPWLRQQKNHDGGRVWKATNENYGGANMFNEPGIWKTVAPAFAMTIPTNHPDINIQIKQNEFNLVAETPQEVDKDILTSAVWYFHTQNDEHKIINQLKR